MPTAATLLHLLRNERALAATEYALIAMLIAVAAASGIGILGDEVNKQYVGIDKAVQEAGE